MFELIKGDDSHPIDPYIKLLKSQPFFKREGLQSIICNLILLAIHDGMF